MYALQQQEFTNWLFKQSAAIVLSVLGVGSICYVIYKIVTKWIKPYLEEQRKRNDEKDSKHEAMLKAQIDKAERRADTSLNMFTEALERRDRIADDTARAVERVNDSLKTLAERIDRSGRSK